MSETGGRVDAHHHLWDTGRRDYPWMDGPWADPLRGAFGPGEYATACSPYGVGRSVVVQAVSDTGETRELLSVAASDPRIAGVVGWVDVTAPDLAERLAALRAAPGGETLVGVRHQAENEPDPGWLLRDDVVRGLRLLAAAGLVYDLLVRAPQLAAAADVVRLLPEVSFVLDHLGKPAIGDDMAAWADAMTRLAGSPNVTAKLSGLVTEADRRSWTPDQLLPYAEHALATFGPDRLMFGSDWPVCTLAATYGQVVSVAEAAVAPLGPGERKAVFGGTAVRTYGLERLAEPVLDA